MTGHISPPIVVRVGDVEWRTCDADGSPAWFSGRPHTEIRVDERPGPSSAIRLARIARDENGVWNCTLDDGARVRRPDLVWAMIMDAYETIPSIDWPGATS